MVWADEDILMRYAQLYAGLRKLSAKVSPNDLWIGAAAVVRGLPLLTRNVADLSRIEGLQIADYTGPNHPPV